MNLLDADGLSSKDLAEIDFLVAQTDAPAAVHRSWVRGGEKAVAQWGVEDAKSRARKEFVGPCELAEAFSWTGNKDETMKYLEEGLRMRDPKMVNIQKDPVFDFLSSDPRYHVLIKKIGTPLLR